MTDNEWEAFCLFHICMGIVFGGLFVVLLLKKILEH